MTYQKDQTSILQTATRVASEIVCAEVAAGILKSHDTLVARFDEERDRIFASLDVAREADNEMFKAEEAAAPAKGAKTYTKRAPSGGGSGGGDIDNPGSVVIKGNGKFTGLTVADVFALTPSEAEAYGYKDKQGNAKAGSEYIAWMATNDKGPFMQKVAKAFIEEKRASSAEEAA